ncbi:ATP-binding protein [Pedobacter antarcticus]|uniref:ATP-binding protein n=1 Tax=Pedobacter antarcticus TaxID=34086 RepID=UPI00292D18EF|nr:ATP-binding protein [Pedobacter antarcticus]
MTNITEKPEIKKAITEYCEVKAISRNELAAQIGVSGATLSNMVNDKWDNIDDRMWLRVFNYVRSDNAGKLYSTTDFNAVTNLCEQAKSKHYMSGLIADYGMGKTTALKAYARNENVFYIYYDCNMKPKHFFYELGKQMGYEYDASVYDQVKKACDTLNTLVYPLIIVDESSKLSDAMLMTLHVLRDKTINNCGLVLAGMPYFKNNLIKKAQKQKVGISEFLSRIMIWHELEGLRSTEIEYICQTNGITNKKVVSGLKTFKKFRDLSNEILLHNTLSQ